MTTDIPTAVRRLVNAQNVPIQEVAARHGITIQQVKNIISNTNKNHMKSSTSYPRPKVRTKSFDNEVKQLRKKGFTIDEIARVKGCSACTVKRSLEGNKPKPKKVAKKADNVQAKPRTSTFSLLWGAFSYTKTSQ